MALEVALRRLTINAIQSDAAVQAHLRAFLGFPPLKAGGSLSGGGGEGAGAAGRLAGVDAEVARHLARVPADLELALSGGRGSVDPVPLLGNLRAAMWMVLSGAAHKVGGRRRRKWWCWWWWWYRFYDTSYTSKQRLGLSVWVYVVGRCVASVYVPFTCC